MTQFKNILVTCKKKYYSLGEYFLSDIIPLNKITVSADDLTPFKCLVTKLILISLYRITHTELEIPWLHCENSVFFPNQKWCFKWFFEFPEKQLSLKTWFSPCKYPASRTVLLLLKNIKWPIGCSTSLNKCLFFGNWILKIIKRYCSVLPFSSQNQRFY